MFFTTLIRSAMRAMASDDATLLVADVSGALNAFSLLSGDRLCARASGHEGAITSLDATSDARHVVTAADDGVVKIWHQTS